MNERFLLKKMLFRAARSQNCFDIVAHYDKREVLNSRCAGLIRGEAGGLYLLGAGAEQTLFQIAARRVGRIHDAD